MDAYTYEVVGYPSDDEVHHQSDKQDEFQALPNPHGYDSDDTDEEDVEATKAGKTNRIEYRALLQEGVVVPVYTGEKVLKQDLSNLPKAVLTKHGIENDVPDSKLPSISTSIYSGEIEFPTYAGLLTILHMMHNAQNVQKVPMNDWQNPTCLQLVTIISYFARYPSFRYNYERFLEKPDAQVKAPKSSMTPQEEKEYISC
ncbi:hypothetical protein QAD02_016174 [Eretmocerus hayati]|uniref:Uncharacterized protein n=1 Tax=Eretmocerus hayati TaxID=131215 RepID=A0ACC2PAC5_9HYME|nr:hypothetical protein QAD02_016174 [Eretmocerus hayati]